MQIAVEIKTWISDYITLCYIDVIIYPCLKLDAGLDDLC